jgi:hypothetical protein
MYLCGGVIEVLARQFLVGGNCVFDPSLLPGTSPDRFVWLEKRIYQ